MLPPFRRILKALGVIFAVIRLHPTRAVGIYLAELAQSGLSVAEQSPSLKCLEEIVQLHGVAAFSVHTVCEPVAYPGHGCGDLAHGTTCVTKLSEGEGAVGEFSVLQGVE